MSSSPPSPPLRLGLVGCGLMGGHYADVFSRMENVELSACCDPTPAKLTAFAEDKGFRRSFLDFREMIRTGKLDGILNVTHDSLHAEVALEALGAGIPLMTEKPLAAAAGECRLIAGAAEKAGVPVVVNFSKRNAVAVETTRLAVAGGFLGELRGADIAYRQGWVINRDWGDWEEVHAWTWRLSASTAPMGVLGDLGSHLIDMLRHICGREVTSVSNGDLTVVNKGRKSVGDLELDSPDTAGARFMLDGGIPAAMECSRVDAGHRDTVTLELAFEKGRLLLDLAADRKSVEVIPSEDIPVPEDFTAGGGPADGNRAAGRAFAGQPVRIAAARPKSSYILFAEAGQAFRSGGPVSTTGVPGIADGIAVQDVMDAIAASHEQGGAAVRPGEGS